MTKEQSEAIERIKYLLFIYKKDDEKGYRATGDVFDTDFKAIETVLNMLKEKDTEIEKKDKMIDLMAEWISERCLYIDDYGNSCEIIQDSCNKKENCELCIKQYFERKVEDECKR